MRKYTLNELNNMNYHDLYNIAIDEKIISIYTEHRNREEIIEILLKYRGEEDKYIIREYIPEAMYNLQLYIDKYVRINDENIEEIKVNKDYTFYSDIDIYENDEYILSIDKESTIGKDIVLLVNKKGYIYAILYLTIKSHDNRYIQYYLNTRYVFIEIYKEIQEDIYLLFFNKNDMPQIYEKYSSNKYIEAVNIIAKRKNIGKISIKNVEKIINILPIYININNIISIYGNKKIDISNIQIEVNEYIKELEVKNRLKIENVYYINEKYRQYSDNVYEDIKNINESNLLNYRIANQEIENLKEIININVLDNILSEKEYLLLSLNEDSFKIYRNKYLIKEKNISYHIELESNELYENLELSENNIINNIYEYIYKNKVKYDKYYKENLNRNKIKEIKDNKIYYFHIIQEDIEIEEDEQLKEKANDIYSYYLNEDYEEYIFSDNIIIYKKDIENIIIEIIHKCLAKFFDDYTIINIIKEFKNIKLVGGLLYKDVFYNAIKEYIPGKLINNKNINIKNEYVLVDAVNILLENKYKGNNTIYSKYIKLEKIYNIEYEDYKKNRIHIFNSKIDDIKYFDKISAIKELNLIIINDNIENEENIIISDNYIEMDEKEIVDRCRLNKSYLNNINNNNIRFIISKQENKVILINILRKNNQLYLGNEYTLAII